MARLNATNILVSGIYYYFTKDTGGGTAGTVVTQGTTGAYAERLAWSIRDGVAYGVDSPFTNGLFQVTLDINAMTAGTGVRVRLQRAGSLSGVADQSGDYSAVIETTGTHQFQLYIDPTLFAHTGVYYLRLSVETSRLSGHSTNTATFNVNTSSLTRMEYGTVLSASAGLLAATSLSGDATFVPGTRLAWASLATQSLLNVRRNLLKLDPTLVIASGEFGWAHVSYGEETIYTTTDWSKEDSFRWFETEQYVYCARLNYGFLKPEDYVVGSVKWILSIMRLDKTDNTIPFEAIYKGYIQHVDKAGSFTNGLGMVVDQDETIYIGWGWYDPDKSAGLKSGFTWDRYVISSGVYTHWWASVDGVPSYQRSLEEFTGLRSGMPALIIDGVLHTISINSSSAHILTSNSPLNMTHRFYTIPLDTGVMQLHGTYTTNLLFTQGLVSDHNRFRATQGNPFLYGGRLHVHIMEPGSGKQWAIIEGIPGTGIQRRVSTSAAGFPQEFTGDTPPIVYGANQVYVYDYGLASIFDYNNGVLGTRRTYLNQATVPITGAGALYFYQRSVQSAQPRGGENPKPGALFGSSVGIASCFNLVAEIGYQLDGDSKPDRSGMNFSPIRIDYQSNVSSNLRAFGFWGGDYLHSVFPSYSYPSPQPANGSPDLYEYLIWFIVRRAFDPSLSSPYASYSAFSFGDDWDGVMDDV